MRRQTAKILALSSGFVGKHNFLTSKYVLSQKYFLEKAATIKRFEHLSLGSEFKMLKNCHYKKKNNIKDYKKSWYWNIAKEKM